MLESDYDEVELDDDVAYRLVLREIAPSLEAWLSGWLDAAILQDSMAEAARSARGLEPDQPGHAA
jgi:hypothetical protein